MHSLLSQIQSTVIKYANVMAQIIKVDVEIMDDNLKRIAGTGEYENLVNRNMVNDGKVYKAVFRTKNLHIVKEQGKDEFCSLNEVVDRLEQGVIVLDKNNCISQINKCAN